MHTNFRSPASTSSSAGICAATPENDAEAEDAAAEAEAGVEAAAAAAAAEAAVAAAVELRLLRRLNLFSNTAYKRLRLTSVSYSPALSLPLSLSHPPKCTYFGCRIS